MRHIISILIIVIATLSMLMQQADARRFGGGRSFGYQRSVSQYSNRNTSSAQPVSTNPQRPGNRWLGPIAGLVAGGLLSYLLMGHGLGTGLLSWLAIAFIGLMLWNLIRSKLQPAHFNAVREMPTQNHYSESNQTNFSSATVYPIGFDPETFLRESKVQFIRLQTAYDNKNLDDLREFTAPEVYGEIQLQLQDRGEQTNHTDVVKLDAELLDVNIESQASIASVRFSGLIKEEQNGNAESFNEVWHFKKYSTHSKWIVAGVQQQ